MNNKAIDLYSFIMELKQLELKKSSQKPILNYETYDWKLFLADVPENSDYIQKTSKKRRKTSNEANLLFSVSKPEFISCPPPPEDMVLEEGWNDYKKEMTFKEEDEKKTSKVFIEWFKLREEWVKKQEEIEKIRTLFSELYQFYFKLEEEPESKEIIVANGILLDKEDEKIQHPVLTRRVKLNYDVKQNVISIVDTDAPSMLYTTLFQNMKNINRDNLGKLTIELQTNDYHPLETTPLIEYFKMLINLLSSESYFSEKGIPENWEKDNRLLLYLNPCFIVRSKLDPTVKAIEKIVENIKETGYVPEPIEDIIGDKDKKEVKILPKESIDEQLIVAGGESIEILLTKMANKEQLEIAKYIDSYPAVLVQGPPGTGKTHTISNLIGHFLAQGKNILVTSKTNKALSVLKEKVVPGLQDLCVSVLDDSKKEMENAIDSITERVSRVSSYELEDEIASMKEERITLFNALNQVRQRIRDVLNQEHKPIEVNGESLLPIEASKYVAENEEKLAYIPGKVKTVMPLPLSMQELRTLYQTNKEISVEDEKVLKNNVLDPAQIISPAVFKSLLEQLQRIDEEIQKIQQENQWEVIYNNKKVVLKRPENTIHMSLIENIEVINQFCKPFEKKEEWIKYALLEGSTVYKRSWHKLIELIEETCIISEMLLPDQIGNIIEIHSSESKKKLKIALAEVKDIFENKGKIDAWSKWFNKRCKIVQSITINGKEIEFAEQCQFAIDTLSLEEKREECATYWDNLLGKHGVTKFYDLAKENQEHCAAKWITSIQFYLKWYEEEYEKLKSFHLPLEQIFMAEEWNSETIDAIFTALTTTIPTICKVQQLLTQQEEIKAKIERTTTILTRKDSSICKELLETIYAKDSDAYAQSFALLKSFYSKLPMFRKRQELLAKLKPVAPDWAKAIENRQGIHGDVMLPLTIEEAWKWKQYATLIDEMIQESVAELQKENLQLSQKYRTITAEYAEKLGWYHLLKKNESNSEMKQALQGWKQMMHQIEIEKDDSLKPKARELMVKCQEAVPCWIMRIDTVLENLNPKQNKFDVIIIDEASQVDISALAVLYMGKKMIIVGDDKQVSPTAVGVNLDKVKALEKMYIEGKIPNAHLYNPRTSIYDLAFTTFPTIVLREHFRCVPEIIGYSNGLSYDNTIKPLREANSSDLVPPIISYRVGNGERTDNTKKNPNEAKTIVALLKSCIEQEKYSGKTFGIISLLGNEQVKEIEKEMDKEIEPSERINRKILCGDATNFQGDERDVIFLSMVDSGTGKKPLDLRSAEKDGKDLDVKKRYNVAVSRAKDQLWIVHSLDVESDLKMGDIRKSLLDYANTVVEAVLESEEKEKDSFETEIFKALIAKDYDVVQQWKVGTYCLDMVVQYDTQKIAIKCESGYLDDTKVREAMEKQIILESLGWRFINIRGSEFYRNRRKTMERVLKELTDYGIYPISDIQLPEETELLMKIKRRAFQILKKESFKK